MLLDKIKTVAGIDIHLSLAAAFLRFGAKVKAMIESYHELENQGVRMPNNLFKWKYFESV